MSFRMATVAPEKQVHPLPAIAFNGVVKGDDMNQRIGAIETWYAGHKFRSRLEARWAVFFDALGVEWRYESQGFEGGGHRYLPDFFLPAFDVWCEVKAGYIVPEDDAEKISAVIMSGAMDGLLCAFDVPRCHNALLLLGEVPDPRGIVFLPALQHSAEKGLVSGWAIFFKHGDSGAYFRIEPDSVLHSLSSLHRYSNVQDKPGGEGWSLKAKQVQMPPVQACSDAFLAARSARFEHGQSGAV